MNANDQIRPNNGVQLDLAFDLEYFVTAAEASLFAVGSAIAFDKLAESIGTSSEYIPIILEELKKRYDSRETAIEILIMKDYAVMCTKSVYGDIVRKALEIRKNQPLSKAALEVLAVIAYNQPTTRAFVEKVRGVESPSVISTLAEKGLIEECGRLDTPGRPVLYATTPVFLRTFGLASIEDLGPVPQIEGFENSGAASEDLMVLKQHPYHEDQLTFDENAFMVTVSPEDELIDDGADIDEQINDLITSDIYDISEEISEDK